MSCASKVRYASLPQASASIRTIRRAKADSGERIPTRAYFCRSCRGYHLTSQPLSDSPRAGL